MSVDIIATGTGIIGTGQAVVYPYGVGTGPFYILSFEGIGSFPFARGAFDPVISFEGICHAPYSGIGDFESPIRTEMKGRGQNLGNSWLAWFKVFNELS